MKAYPLEVLAAAMGGELVGAPRPGKARTVTGGVCTDTRKLVAGSLFFALRGENYDAHDFLANLPEEPRLAAVVVESSSELQSLKVPSIRVENTLAALQKLAAWYRQEISGPVIVITGSNGKTSTKELVRAVLETKFRVHATKGNLNNHIGLPLSILATLGDAEVRVFEIGMNHAGELAPLCEIAKPDFGIITNVGRAHIEHLGSREAIAEEKGTLARALPNDGLLVIPDGDDFADYLQGETQADCVRVGIGEETGAMKVSARDLRQTSVGWNFQLHLPEDPAVEVNLPLFGRHMVTNALLAAAIGRELDLTPTEISKGLATVNLGAGRLRSFQREGLTVFDDTYNANPDSVIAALETLAAFPLQNGGRKFAVLGHMAELGDHGPAAHREIGRKALDARAELISVGELAGEITTSGGTHFSTREEAASHLKETLKPGDAVLFKGSRSAAMEGIIHQLFPEP